MKNLLKYVSPNRDFGIEEKVTVKIQIDNSLDLGWKRQDIFVLTNFPYEYRGVKTIPVSDESYCSYWPQVTKINVILELFEKGLIEKDEIYWFHDFDVFQNYPISKEELELENFDMGLCDKGRMPRWATGSVFFKIGSRNIFRCIKEVAYKYQVDEEVALNAITSNNELWVTEPHPEDTMGERIVPLNMQGIEQMNDRIKKINIKYNFAGWNIRSCYKLAGGLFKVVHFHPFDTIIYPGDVGVLDFFLRNKNKMGLQLIPDRLLKIFHRYGIK